MWGKEELVNRLGMDNTIVTLDWEGDTIITYNCSQISEISPGVLALL